MERLTGIVVLLASVAGQALAQDDAGPGEPEDLTLPPVIAQGPGDVRLGPAPDDREGDGIDVEVTGGQTDWRLPDLGTSLRDEEVERELDQRMEFQMAPLYDPEKQVEMLAPVPVVDVQRNVGFLQIFKVGFGRRSLPDEALPDDELPDDASPDDAGTGETAPPEPPRN